MESKGKTIAYVRVSSDAQDVENQRLEILKLSNEKNLGKVTMIDEIVSGRKSWRERSISTLLDGLGKDDNLVVAEMSRLGRSMLEIMEILATCARKGVRVYAAKGSWSLDNSLQSKIMAMVLAMAAEIERDLISQRTKSALATKKAQGISLGRPKGPGKSKLDKESENIKELLRLGVPQRRVAAMHGTTEVNLNHWMKKRNIPRARNGKAS